LKCAEFVLGSEPEEARFLGSENQAGKITDDKVKNRPSSIERIKGE
jgi:hypothetical protein